MGSAAVNMLPVLYAMMISKNEIHMVFHVSDNPA